MPIEHFETINDFLDCVQNKPLHPSWEGSGTRSSRTEGEEHFYGTRTFGQTIALAEKGWPEGLKNISKKLDLMLSTGRSKMRIHDVAGDLPDVGRFLAGVPVCMTRRTIQQGMKKPVIDLVVNCTFSAGITPDQILNYGAAVAAAIDELENTGFSVGLYVCSVTDCGGATGPIINLKKPGEAMELDRLVFFTANAGFLRRLVFAHWEASLPKDGSGGLCSFTYGTPTELPSKHIPEGAIYFGRNLSAGPMCRNSNSPEKARAYVRSVIRTQRPDLLENETQAA